MRFATRVIGSAWIVLALGGCVSAATTVIANPRTHGVVAPNMVPQADTNRADYFGISPGVFNNEASIVSLDASTICFAVTLRVEADSPTLTRLAGWRVYLRGEHGLEITDARIGPAVVASVQPIAASIPHQEPLGYYNNCTRFGCTPMQRYATIREPTVLNIVTSNNSVCFAHGGVVGASIRDVTLHLDAPDDVMRRLAFRWRFD